MTTMPDVRVEIGAPGAQITDPIARWVDVTDRVTALGCKRGRAYELDRIEAGTARIEFDNSAGDFDLSGLTPRQPIRAYGIADDNWLPALSVNAPIVGVIPAPRWQYSADRGATWSDAEAGTVAGVPGPGGMAHRFIGGTDVRYRSGLGDSDVVHVTEDQPVTISANLQNIGAGADCFLGLIYESYDQSNIVSGYLADPASPNAGWVTITFNDFAPFDGIMRMMIVASTDVLVSAAKVRLDNIGSDGVAELSGVYPIFRGYVERWTQTYSGLLSTVSADCVDHSALLARPIRSSYRMAVHEWASANNIPKAPVIDSSTGANGEVVERLWYWPCVESTDATNTYPEYGTVQPLRMRNCVTPPDEGAAGFGSTKTMVHADGSESGSFFNTSNDSLSGAVLELSRHSSPPLGACRTLTVDLWFLPEGLTHDQTLWAARTSTGVVHSLVEVETDGTVVVQAHTGPSGAIRAFSDSGAVQPGQVVHIGARVGIGSVWQNAFAQVWINGVEHDYFENPNVGAYASPTIGGAVVAGRERNIAPVGYADGPTGSINHVIVGMDVPVGLHQAVDSYGREQSASVESDRLHRILDGLEWRGSRAFDPPQSELLSARWDDGADGWAAASAAAEDAGGVLMMGAAGEAAYQGRRRRIGAPVRWALAEWTPGVRYELDDAHVHNRVTAERSTGLRRTAEDQASIADHGVKALTIRRDVADPAEVGDAAHWVLRRYRDAAPRCDTLRVEAHTLTGSGDGPLRALAAAADISDRLTAATPPGAPTPTLDCFVEGIRVGIVRNGNVWEWVTEFSVSDATRSDGWVLEGPSGRLDTESCVTVY